MLTTPSLLTKLTLWVQPLLAATSISQAVNGAAGIVALVSAFGCAIMLIIAGIGAHQGRSAEGVKWALFGGFICGCAFVISGAMFLVGGITTNISPQMPN